MHHLLQFFMIIFAVSMDGFTVGIAYGMRQIKITLSALLMIMLCSGTIVYMSMLLGKHIYNKLPSFIAPYLGGTIFIILGSYLLVSNIRKEKVNTSKKQHLLYTQLMRDPHIVDQDHSGTITIYESFILGIALALDAFGAGFATAILNYPPIGTAAIIAIMSGLFLYVGLKIGFFLTKFTFINRFLYLPPLILIAVGLSIYIT